MAAGLHPAREGAGEVQTPLQGDAARDLAVAGQVWFRHSRAASIADVISSLVGGPHRRDRPDLPREGHAFLMKPSAVTRIGNTWQNWEIREGAAQRVGPAAPRPCNARLSCGTAESEGQGRRCRALPRDRGRAGVLLDLADLSGIVPVDRGRARVRLRGHPAASDPSTAALAASR